MMFEMSARTRTLHLSCLILWIVLILMVGVLPLSNFVGHSHWEYIKWVPTAEDLRSPKYLIDIFSDIVGNTVLFFPLGYFLSRLLTSSSPSRQWLLAAGFGGTLSLGIEFYQVYCHNRFPSIFDLITNVAGTLMGVSFSLSRKSALPAPQNPTLTPNPPDRSHAP
ncbi:MAG: VanZ family protein [Nitrospiraceae bacterium]|nr:VanZ family protein [Nitrospiraceae bacterium]